MGQHVGDMGGLGVFWNGDEGLHPAHDAGGGQVLHQIHRHGFQPVLLAQLLIPGHEGFIGHAGAVAQDAALAAAGTEHQRHAHSRAHGGIAHQQPFSGTAAAGFVADMAQGCGSGTIAGGQGIHRIQKPGADLVGYRAGFAVDGQGGPQVIHQGIGQADGQQKPQRHHQPQGIQHPVGSPPPQKGTQRQHHQHQRAANQRGFQQKVE